MYSGIMLTVKNSCYKGSQVGDGGQTVFGVSSPVRWTGLETALIFGEFECTDFLS